MAASSDLAALKARVAELEAENAALRAELARIRKRRTAYAGRRSAAIDSGAWEPFADCEPLREHIDTVTRAAGITVNAFAAIAGMDWNTIGAIMDGSRDKVRTVTARKILAVTPQSAEESAGNARVDATGTRRRLQALARNGWSIHVLERRGVASFAVLQAVRDGKKTIAASTRRKVAAAYRELETVQAPETTRGERISAHRTKAEAERRGFAPPGAWDESFIDDPDAEPRWDWVHAGDAPKRRKSDEQAERAEDIRDLTRNGGLSLAEAAARAGITEEWAAELLSRYPETDEEAAA